MNSAEPNLTLLQLVDDTLATYERDFKQNRARALEFYLPADRDHRRHLLSRLIQTDIELRWDAGANGPDLLAGYLAHFPELASDEEGLLGILDAIRELSRKDGLNFSVAAYREGLPALTDAFDKFENRRGSGSPDGGVSTVDHTGSLGTSTGLHLPAKLRDQVKEVPAIPGYEVLRVLASGGMGYVLHARDAGLARDAAIKLPLGSPTAEQRERFLREAKAAAALRHQHICQVYRVDVASNGSPFIAMEFLNGPTLLARIEDQLPTPEQAAALLAPIARAVAYAHAQGIIHRDIKPQNIILRKDQDGELPVLTDFGLAKMLGETNSEVTHSGQVMGSPSYMPPEQAAGKIEKVGPLADVYSLGAVLYQLLTGKPPFTGTTGEVIRKVQTEEPVAPSRLAKHLPRDLETICLKCMEKEPAQRYPSAAALAADLERFLRGEPILARRASPVQRATRWVRRNRIVAGLLALLLLVGVGSAYAVYRSTTKATEETGITLAVREAEGEIEKELAGDNWKPEQLQGQLQKVSDIAARLTELDAARGATANARINTAVHGFGSAHLHTATFKEVDEAYVLQIVSWLRSRDASLADKLAAELQRRKTGRTRLFLVEPPQESPDGKFDPERGGETQVSAEPPYVEFGKPLRRPQGALHLTKIEATGHSEIIVKFAPGWDRLDLLGVGVTVPRDASGGYVFVIKPVMPPSPTTPVTFESARTEDAHIQLQLFRGDRIVREYAMAASKLGTGPLTLTLQRGGDQILAQVNQLPPMKYHDLFPLPGSGVFGVLGQNGVRIIRAEGWRQEAAAAASPLERGDALFLAGKYTDALDAYRQQAVAAGAGKTGSEARLKVGIALFQLERYDEAAKQLRELHDHRSDSLAPLAGCYLIAVHARQKRLDLADEILDRLSLNTPGQSDILTRLPDDIRHEILKPYRDVAGGLGLLREDPARVTKIERVMRAEEALGLRPEYRGWTRLQYIRSLRSSPDAAVRNRAAGLLREWLATDYPPGDTSTPFGNILGAEYGWVMREAGTPQPGLDELDTRVFSAPGVHRPDGYPLLIERARLLVALGKPGDAEKDLRDFLALAPPDQRGPRSAADANLMLGFLLDRRGDAKGAQEAWLAGGSALLLTDPDILLRAGGGISILTGFGCRLLSDTVTDADFEQLSQNLLKSQLGPLWPLVARKVKPEDFRNLAAIIRTSIKKPAGREQMWRFAFQTNSFRDYAQQVVLFSVTEFVREIALGGVASPEQDAVLSRLVSGAVQMYAEGRLRMEHGLPLYGLFQNGWNQSNWDNFAKDVDAPLRAPLAYIVGHRLLRQNRKEDAVTAFRTAATLAPADSPLKKLAEAESAKLAANK